MLRQLVKTLCVITFLQSVPAFGQHRFSIGLSYGITGSTALVTQKNADGKILPGMGMNFCVPFSYSLNDKLSLASGLGYYWIKYKVLYMGTKVASSDLHPYIPIKLTYKTNISESKQFYASAGCVFDFFPVTGKLSFTDSTTRVSSETFLHGKSNLFITTEFGLRKISQNGKAHQLGIQLYYGLQETSNGQAYHSSNPSAMFKWSYHAHFAALQYTYWFGRKQK